MWLADAIALHGQGEAFQSRVIPNANAVQLKNDLTRIASGSLSGGIGSSRQLILRSYPDLS